MTLLRRLKAALEDEKPIRSLGLGADEKALLGGFNLLTLKPMLIVLNVDEAEAGEAAEIEAGFPAEAGLDDLSESSACRRRPPPRGSCGRPCRCWG
jgi:hypothetical protein